MGFELWASYGPSSGSIDGSSLAICCSHWALYVSTILAIVEIPCLKIRWPGFDCRHSCLWSLLYLMFESDVCPKRKMIQLENMESMKFREDTVNSCVRSSNKKARFMAWSSRFYPWITMRDLYNGTASTFLPSRGGDVWATTRGSESGEKILFSSSFTSLMRAWWNSILEILLWKWRRGSKSNSFLYHYCGCGLATLAGNYTKRLRKMGLMP